MLKIDVITLFPGALRAPLEASVLGRGKDKELFDINLIDLREFATDKHRTVDDNRFGGEGGMVLKPEPLFAAVEHVRKRFPAEPSRTVLLSPQGRLLSHDEALRLSRYERLILLCGRYEGVDQRVVEHLVDEACRRERYLPRGGSFQDKANVLLHQVYHETGPEIPLDDARRKVSQLPRTGRTARYYANCSFQVDARLVGKHECLDDSVESACHQYLVH